jgi:hypothetical protein
MPLSNPSSNHNVLNTNNNYKVLYTLGGIAAFLQLAAILAYGIITAILGPKPATAEEYFLVQQSSKLAAALRGDFLLLILIGLYLFTFSALYVALRRVSPIFSALATLFTFIVVTTTFATESTFSLLNLGDKFAVAVSEVERAQFLAAGEAVIASDMWNSSGAYMGGILLQGSGVMISVIMLRSKDFSKVTAYSGIVANSLDLIQHILHPFFPPFSGVITSAMGLFYLVWFPMLGRDLLRLGRGNQKDLETP